MPGEQHGRMATALSAHCFYEARDRGYIPVPLLFADFVSDLLVILNIMCNFVGERSENDAKKCRKERNSAKTTAAIYI